MPIVVTGFGPIDGPHRELARCVADLSAAVRTQDGAEVRGWLCLLTEMLAEHFSEEEELMRRWGWSLVDPHVDAHARLLSRIREFDRSIGRKGLSHEMSSGGLSHLHEMIRYHCIVSDFGFAKFAMGLAGDPFAPRDVGHVRHGCAYGSGRRWRMGWHGRRQRAS